MENYTHTHPGIGIQESKILPLSLIPFLSSFLHLVYSNWIDWKGYFLSWSTSQGIQGLLQVPQISSAVNPLLHPQHNLPGLLCRSQHHSPTAADVAEVSKSFSQSIDPHSSLTLQNSAKPVWGWENEHNADREL